MAPFLSRRIRPRYPRLMERLVRVRRRLHLPHREVDEGTYFVTFRLFDSLPPGFRAETRREAEEKLDEGLGARFLAVPAVATMVLDALKFFHGERYFLHCGCVMPNHLHAVFRCAAQVTLSQVMHAWKSFTAKEANEILGRTGTFWEEEWMDSLIHDQNELDRAMKYVLENPMKAGLRDWPWAAAFGNGFRLKGGLE